MPVKKYDRKDRSKPFGVKWGHWKNPNFKFFEFPADRDEFMNALIKKEKEEGMAALRVSTYEAQVIRRCVELVGSPERVLSLCEAEAGQSIVQEKSPADAVKEYLDEKMNLGRDDNYYRQIKNILTRFISACPSQRIADIDYKTASQWIFSLGYAPSTVRNYQKICSAFIEWCIKHRYCRRNVFKDMPIPHVTMPEPEFLSIDQAESIFSVAAEHYPDALAYLSLQAFAGIRSSACARIEPHHIDFDKKGILIRAEAAKNKRRIFVDGHPENLWSWLDYAKETAQDGFQLSKRLWDRRKEQIARITKFRMPHNALRHSFCTYHVAMDGNAGRTATLLTHRGNVDLLYEHYKGNATQAEGKAWFNLLPPNYPS